MTRYTLHMQIIPVSSIFSYELLKGSPVHVEKMALMKLLKDYVGKKVELEFKGEQYDPDLSDPGSNCTVLSVDEEWVLVHIVSRKKEKEKLFHLRQINSVKGIV